MRSLLLAALVASGCSYSEEKADIKVHVDNIPAAADHLNVIVTSSDTSVASSGCTAEFTGAAPNAQCYRPTFQPESLDSAALDLAFAQPSASGTFTISAVAADRNNAVLAAGVAGPALLPGPVELQMTLH